MERSCGRTWKLWTAVSGKCMLLFVPSLHSLLPSRAHFLPDALSCILVIVTDTVSSNSRPMLPFHCSSSTFYCWFRVSRMLLLYQSRSQHSTKSWSSSPKVSMSPPLARTTVRESSKSIGNQRYRNERDSIVRREEMRVSSIRHDASDNQPCSAQCRVHRWQHGRLHAEKLNRPPILPSLSLIHI